MTSPVSRPNAARLKYRLFTSETVGDLPPIVIADLFGVSPRTANRWAQLAGQNWAAYLEARDIPPKHSARAAR